MARKLPFEIRVDAREALTVSLRLKALAKRQGPFAEASALTDTAKDGARVGQASLSPALNVRNRALKPTAKGRSAAVGFLPAEKKAPKRIAWVGTKPWAEFLTLHATGGVRKGRGGHRIAVRTRIVKRTSSGRVSKRHLPRKLRARKGLDEEALKSQGRIRVRTARTRGRSIFFHLVRRARYRKRWPIREVVKAEVVRKFPGHYRRRLEQALRTAR